MSTEAFNCLTDAEAERLAMLAEECGETIQIIGKILRHGYESFDPNDGGKTTNRHLLQAELDDLAAIRLRIVESGELVTTPDVRLRRIWSKKLRYTHHQL